MLKRRITIQPTLGNAKTSTKPVDHDLEQQKQYQKHYDHLNRLIGSLPNTCVYKAAAQEVLDKVKNVKENHTWKLPDPMESAIETLVQTIDILTPLTTGAFRASPSPSRVLSLEETKVTLLDDEIDSDEEPEILEPTIISEAYLAQLKNYEEFGRSLKWKGGLQILAGAIGGLVSIILLAIYTVACALFPIVARTFGIVSYTVLSALFTGGLFSGVLGCFSIVGSYGLILNGVIKRSLANSVQGLVSKVNEHLNTPAPKGGEQMALSLATDPFKRGLSYLNTDVENALACFRQVPESSPQYLNAQGLIQIYTPKKAEQLNSPSKQSVFRLDPSYREREANASAQPSEEGELEIAASHDAPRSRRRLDFSNTDEYSQYLLDKVADDQAEEREREERERRAVAVVNR